MRAPQPLFEWTTILCTINHELTLNKATHKDKISNMLLCKEITDERLNDCHLTWSSLSWYSSKHVWCGQLCRTWSSWRCEIIQQYHFLDEDFAHVALILMSMLLFSHEHRRTFLNMRTIKVTKWWKRAAPIRATSCFELGWNITVGYKLGRSQLKIEIRKVEWISVTPFKKSQLPSFAKSNECSASFDQVRTKSSAFGRNA